MSYFLANKICCIADIHIGIHNDSPFWHKVHTDWAKWLVNELKQKNIKDIVICGDFFDSRDEIAVNTLHEGTNILSLFKDFKVTILCGNHDVYLKNSSEINSLQAFKHWPNVVIVDKTTIIEQNNKKYAFIPWGENIENITTKVNIIFGHFEFSTFKMNTTKICDDGLDPHSVAKLAPLVISGHFHLKDYRNIKNSVVMYTGNPFEMDFGDAGAEKGYYIVDIETLKTEFCVNKQSPRHKKILLSWLVSQNNINDVVKNNITGNIVKLIIDRRISSVDSELLFTKLKMLNPEQFAVEIEYTNNFLLDEEKQDLSGVDINQAIIEFTDMMDINNKAQVQKYLLELYEKTK